MLSLVLGTWIFPGTWTYDLGASEKPPCCRETAPSTPITDKSLYQLDSTWTSDQGRRVKLGVLRGRPQVLALFFTRCEFACPIIVHDMKQDGEFPLVLQCPEFLYGLCGDIQEMTIRRHVPSPDARAS